MPYDDLQVGNVISVKTIGTGLGFTGQSHRCVTIKEVIKDVPNHTLYRVEVDSYHWKRRAIIATDQITKVHKIKQTRTCQTSKR